MSLFFMPQRETAAASTETGSEESAENAVLEHSEDDNVVSLNVQALLEGGAPKKSSLRAFKASLDDTTDAGSFVTRRPLVRLRRSVRERRLIALKSLRAKKAVGISDRRPELVLGNQLQR
ncbi:MAG: hypothetical protein AAF340_05400 [Pseudomonadota bacterium]